LPIYLSYKVRNDISFAIFCTVGNTDRFLEYGDPYLDQCGR